MSGLVLSLFPGIGLLDMAFEEEGFCVVRGPDVIWGGDVRRFHPPSGRFDGVIGGPPCQHWAQSHNLSGDKDKHLNLIPEFERCIGEARPAWFVMENVTGAPLPAVDGYHVDAHVIEAREVGGKQLRRRRFSFGSNPPLMIMWPAGEKADYHHTFTGSPAPQRRRDGTRANGGVPFTLADYREAFGLPEAWDIPPFKQSEKFQALGNGVPLPVGRAIARAVKKAIGS